MKTIRDKYDLLTLAIKQQLIGSELGMEDGTFLEIADYFIDYRTGEIHITFIDGTGSSFDLGEKYFVKVDSQYKSIPSKKKHKKHKKQKKEKK